MIPVKHELIKARNEQVCQVCGIIISPGEYYHRFAFGRKGNIKICQRTHKIKSRAEAIRRDE